MKHPLIIAIGLSLFTLHAYAVEQQTITPAAVKAYSIKTDTDKISYAIGVEIGQDLQAQSITVNADIVAQGIKDGAANGPFLMTKEEMQQASAMLQKQSIEEQKVKFKQISEKNAKEGADFLAKNKQEKGVMVLPSGLQYRVIEAGTGPKPTLDDFVTVDYEGKFINGEVFDSSFQQGKSINFQLSKVIPGWQEALQKMATGSTWELFIPSSLAFGERGVRGAIEPNSALIFKVKLDAIGVEKQVNEASSSS
jgi:FKBP-type peptidyl-prolyl cis-trans isomerase FklB